MSIDAAQAVATSVPGMKYSPVYSPLDDLIMHHEELIQQCPLHCQQASPSAPQVRRAEDVGIELLPKRLHIMLVPMRFLNHHNVSFGHYARERPHPGLPHLCR